ncbi:MAG: YidC/Oxa1 family membrane protein insertase [Candidatus Gracilibacteria bacterium]|nr:YidC/Oxa1 family membrane protein insertase [Candidatus Gracilibacteria bacterium]
MNRKNLGLFLIVFAIVLLINSFFASKNQEEVNQNPSFEFTSSKSIYHPGDKVVLTLVNNSGQTVTLTEDCPAEPLDVYRKEGAEWKLLAAEAEENGLFACSELAQMEVLNGTSLVFNYAPWNQQLFSDQGEYKVEAVLETTSVSEEAGVGPAAPTNRTLIVEFSVAERGIFRSFGLAVFYKPILNFLVFLTDVLPGNNLGWSIIILTLVVRAILFVPTYRSLEQQKSMQEIQPKLQALKEKYKGDQQKLGEETMKLYKEHGVNPFGSCLPILIQLPFLWAIFQILREGLDASTTFLLYAPLQDFHLDTINVAFLGFDLSTVPTNFYLRIIPPILVGGSQFLTMKLTQSRQKKKIKDITPSVKKEPNQMKEMEKATGMMMYMMPVMIAFFAYSYPVGLSLYWFCSTVFGIGQQLVLNKRKEQLNSKQA